MPIFNRLMRDRLLGPVPGFAISSLLLAGGAALADPLPSWNDTATEAAIVDFVERVTDPASNDYVPIPDRIAVFDNDGTLWAEQPVYFQGRYAIDRLAQKAAADPSILTSDVLRAGASGNMAGVMAGGMEGLLEIVNVSHSGVTVDEFKADVRDWLTTSTHPTTGMRYIDMTYQPMTELLRYLRDEGFTTYIVSGGGIDFIRAFAEDAYGIPPAQVVGSQGASHYEVRNGVPVVVKDGGISFVDDKEGKPAGIDRFIGQRPILAGGNSDGDFQMLEWVTAGNGPRLGILLHHTDGDREFAYDRDSSMGRLADGLDQAAERGWILVDMKNDWSRIWTATE